MTVKGEQTALGEDGPSSTQTIKALFEVKINTSNWEWKGVGSRYKTLKLSVIYDLISGPCQQCLGYRRLSVMASTLNQMANGTPGNLPQ